MGGRTTQISPESPLMRSGRWIRSHVTTVQSSQTGVATGVIGRCPYKRCRGLDAGCPSYGCGLGSIIGSEFGEDRRDVVLDGSYRDEEMFGHLSVAHAVGK